MARRVFDIVGRLAMVDYYGNELKTDYEVFFRGVQVDISHKGIVLGVELGTVLVQWNGINHQSGHYSNNLVDAKWFKNKYPEEFI